MARLEEKSYKKAEEKYLSKVKRNLMKGRGEIFEQGKEKSYKKAEEKYLSKAREILEYKAAKAAQLLLQTECTTIGEPQI